MLNLEKNSPSESRSSTRDTRSQRIHFRRYGSKHVAILLATFDGAKCLPDQLCSFKNQTHQDWSLWVSDDGSSDDSSQVINCFKRAEQTHNVRIFNGPQRGFAMNFLSLIRNVNSDVPYVAFSDQDDSWLPQKLERGLSVLSDIPDDVPAVYCGRTWICSPTLRKIRRSPWFQKKPNFQNAIVQSIGGGNTMLLNAAALALVKKASDDVQEIASHDWWTYQLVTGAGGKVIYDKDPMVLYRQHDNNVIGADGGLRATFGRLAMVIAGTFQSWNTLHERALVHSSAILTAENQSLLRSFQRLRRTTIFDRVKRLQRSGIYHQTALGTMGLWVAAILNRI